MSAVLEARNVNFAYPGGSDILSSFDFLIEQGEFCALIGPSGAGKTTVFRILSGYLMPAAGTVLLRGKDVCDLSGKERASVMAVVPQFVYTPAPFTVRQMAEMGRASKISRLAPLSDEDREHVFEALEMMDVAQYADRYYINLSGGERQRVRLAMALAQEPEILLLDEPLSSLDIGHASRLMKLLSKLNREKKITVLMISHDIQLSCRFCGRLVLLKNGSVLADGPLESVMKHSLIEEAYGCKVELLKSEGGNYLLSPL